MEVVAQQVSQQIALSDLAPILAAVLGPMLALAVAMMRFQHVGFMKLRDLIDESNRELRGLIQDNRERIDESNRELRGLIEESNREMSNGLVEVRERLSRIEGHLRLPPPASDGDAHAA